MEHTDLKWISAMSERLRETNINEMDDETKELIIRAFQIGLSQDSFILQELKSSSLIESDYFDDE